MRKNPIINPWSTYPTRHEAVLWGIAGIAISMACSAFAVASSL